MTHQKPRFVLHVEAEPMPDGRDRGGMGRLKAILKRLRAYRFTCRRIEYPEAAEPQAPADDYCHPFTTDARPQTPRGGINSPGG